MSLNQSGLRAAFARILTLACISISALLTGCASFYVDGNTKVVAASEFKKPNAPRPVQLVFEFQTRGAPNTRATDLVKPEVVQQVTSSGLFSTMVDRPASDSGLLSITINNVPLTDDAFTKGFVTGLTFGLAGSKVSDGYVCTVKYLPPGASEPIVKTARHAIHATIGAAAAPGNATPAPDGKSAVMTMVDGVVSTALNDLSKDPQFQ